MGIYIGVKPGDCLGKVRLRVHGANDVADVRLGLYFGASLGECGVSPSACPVVFHPMALDLFLARGVSPSACPVVFHPMALDLFFARGD